MAAMAGLLNHSLTAGQGLTGVEANPMAAAPAAAGASGGSDASDSSSATISANDFLTLLVTEMQNQDPTADTDPNEYINQLVQVNSLEQLISINQNLSTALGDGSSSSTGQIVSGQPTAVPAASSSSVTAAGPAAKATSAASAPHRAGGLQARPQAGANTAAAISQFAQSVSARHAPGNLTVPKPQPAAHKVAHALDGHSHVAAAPGRLSEAQ